MAAFEGTDQPIDFVNENVAYCALDLQDGPGWVVAVAVAAIQDDYDEVTNRWST